MIWTLIILQSKFLGLSREEHVIILPIVRNFEHQASCEPFHPALSVHHPSDPHDRRPRAVRAVMTAVMTRVMTLMTSHLRVMT